MTTAEGTTRCAARKADSCCGLSGEEAGGRRAPHQPLPQSTSVRLCGSPASLKISRFLRSPHPGRKAALIAEFSPGYCRPAKKTGGFGPVDLACSFRWLSAHFLHFFPDAGIHRSQIPGVEHVIPFTGIDHAVIKEVLIQRPVILVFV